MKPHRLSCHHVDSETVSPISIQSLRVASSVKLIWSCRVLFKPSPITTCIPSPICPVHTSQPASDTWRCRIRILINRRHVEAFWGTVRRQVQEVQAPLARQDIGQQAVGLRWHQTKLILCKRNVTHLNNPSKFNFFLDFHENFLW